MATTVPVNPFTTSTFTGSFYAASDGYVQGLFRDDPAVRFALAGGWLSQSETLPMWGGLPVYEQVKTPSSSNPNAALGNPVGRATTITQTTSTGIAGFSVFNQAYNMIIDPSGGSVPLSASGMMVNFFRLGSGARIPVQCDPSLANYEGDAIGVNVSWDFTNGRLTEYDASTATIATNGTVTWASTSGGQLTFPVAAWTGAWQPGAGDVVTISGATNTGSGGASAINTSFTVVSSTTTGVVLAAPAATGVFGTIGGSPVINFGVGILPVKLLDVSTSGNMTVNWNGSTATWNTSGAAALILI